MATSYRKKPVSIEAVQWTGENGDEVAEFVGTSASSPQPDKLLIHTLEGAMTASVGDFIIRGVQGEFYPCKPDIFAETYSEV
jgi:hypothetical protein